MHRFDHLEPEIQGLIENFIFACQLQFNGLGLVMFF